jgi:Exopolysaccharide biosynthesis protein YbjH
VKGRAPLSGSGTAAARRAGRKTGLAGTAALAAILLAAPAQAQDNSDPGNLFGSRGLMGTPSARMAPDGELSVGASFLENNQHYNLGFEVLPWLDATLRYSGLQHFQPEFPVYYDRAFGFKARLWDESDVVPAVAIGVDDVIGTGVYNGEYLVASKRFGDIDTSLGMGWGRYAGSALIRNPIALVLPSFNNRPIFFGQAGQGDFSEFFHGRNVGIFGGAAWHTPIDGLTLLIEYDSDTYAQEQAFGNFSPRSQVNYGLTYDFSSQTEVGLDWLYGKTLGGSFSLRLDSVHPQFPQKIEAPPPPVAVRTDEQRQKALAALEGLHDPRSQQQARTFQSRNVDRNGFVDALWRLNDDYTDIQVRQDTLDLTVIGPISSARCMATAQLMQGVAVHVGRIRLHSMDGQRDVSCNVQRTVEYPLVSAAFLSTTELENLATPAVKIETIDASDVPAAPNRTQTEHTIKKAIEAQHLFVQAVSLGQGELVIYYDNGHYFAETDAIDRIVRVLSKEAPPEIEKFRLIALDGGVPIREFDVLRGPVERSYQQEDGTIFDHSVQVGAPAMNQPVLAEAAKDVYPQFSWGLYPQFRQELFDPSQPFGVQFLAVVSASLALAPGLSIYGSLEGSLYDDFNTARTSDSLLPHVRSDFVKYFTEGKNGIGNLEGTYTFRLAPDVFVKAKAGYLESMFAGGGGEILWRPEGARWALGADIYQVWQRDFDRLFGLQNYHQTTGHISLYYDSPWYDLNFELRAGQYLAGDRGFTLQITRRFSTGVEIGAFATKTNVSAAQFGEGSFDKGLIIRIPLGWVAPIETQSQIAMDLRPVQRDGGQVLAADATLYDETRATSEGELLRQQSGIMGR